MTVTSSILGAYQTPSHLVPTTKSNKYGRCPFKGHQIQFPSTGQHAIRQQSAGADGWLWRAGHDKSAREYIWPLRQSAARNKIRIALSAPLHCSGRS
ncbi:hypothetical protein EVAR_58788_1 [Eumeta japonica]|uniref:Uncharacterized protein n=1 Tax=Eumeta variegata TaxID=151549 RepID=A0A4C1YMB1_EUMVA|nr:hypothetical protein EVAR_58788_1 [Eumeta japonica]